MPLEELAVLEEPMRKEAEEAKRAARRARRRRLR